MSGSIELAPLTERFDDAEIVDIKAAVKERGVARLPTVDDEDTHPLADGLDDVILRHFFDQLEDHDLACEIYLPVEFEGSFEIGELRVGSAQELLDLLEELKDEFEVEEDLDELEEMERPEEEVSAEGAEGKEEEEEEDDDLMRGWSRYLWKVLFTGARESLEKQLPLHVYR